jgi:hypothetical protein
MEVLQGHQHTTHELHSPIANSRLAWLLVDELLLALSVIMSLEPKLGLLLALALFRMSACFLHIFVM